MSSNTTIKYEVKKLEKEKARLQEILARHLKDQSCCRRSNAGEFQCFPNNDLLARRNTLQLPIESKLQSKSDRSYGFLEGQNIFEARDCLRDTVITSRTGIREEFPSPHSQPVDVSLSASMLPRRIVNSTPDAAQHTSAACYVRTQLPHRVSGQEHSKLAFIPTTIDLLEEESYEGTIEAPTRKPRNTSFASCTITNPDEDTAKHQSALSASTKPGHLEGSKTSSYFRSHRSEAGDGHVLRPANGKKNGQQTPEASSAGSDPDQW